MPGEILDFEYMSGDFYAPGRIKIGNKVEDFHLRKIKNNYNIGWTDNQSVLKQLSKYTGPIKIEVPLHRKGNVIFNFTIDAPVERMKNPNKNSPK